MAAFSWVPLHARYVVAAEGFTDFAARPRRLGRFLGAYGWPGTTGEFLEVVEARTTAHANGIRDQAAAGDETFGRLLGQGVPDAIAPDRPGQLPPIGRSKPREAASPMPRLVSHSPRPCSALISPCGLSSMRRTCLPGTNGASWAGKPRARVVFPAPGGRSGHGSTAKLLYDHTGKTAGRCPELGSRELERVTGIEPALSAWEA